MNSKRHPTLEAEAEYFKSGVAPTDVANFVALKSRVEATNYRKAEALQLENKTETLDQIRTCISRNRLDEAETLIRVSESQIEKTELWLEQARIKNAQAKWSEAKQFALIAIEAGPTGPTLLSLYQVLSIAQFELGEFHDAKKSTSRAISLSEFYPTGLVVLYAKTLEVKINARLYGLGLAQIELDLLWDEYLKSHPGNLDVLLTFMRVQADLKRLAGRDYLVEALCAYHLSKEIGDELYEMLALVELVQCGHTRVAQEAYTLLSDHRVVNNPRIEDLMSDNSQSETSKSLRNFFLTEKTILASRSKFFAPIQAICLPDRSVVIQIKERASTRVSFQPKVAEMLVLVSHHRLSEAELFSSMWKMKYTRDKHHENLRTVFKRIKQQTGLSIKNEKELVELPQALVVEAFCD